MLMLVALSRVKLCSKVSCAGNGNPSNQTDPIYALLSIGGVQDGLWGM